MESFKEFMQKEGFFGNLKDKLAGNQPSGVNPNYTSDEEFQAQRLARMIAAQKAAGYKGRQSVAKPSLSQEPDTVDMPAVPRPGLSQMRREDSPKDQDHPLMKTAHTASGSDENPFEKHDPNHQKWFQYYMNHNMRDHTIN
jgi:hypothetical protein